MRERRGVKNPSLRSEEERDVIVKQWISLPYYVVRKKMANAAVYKLGEEDAVQIGYLALIRAAEIWDDSKGVKFVTYATRSIINRIMQASKGCGLISVPNHVWEKNRKLYKEEGRSLDEAPPFFRFSSIDNNDRIFDYRESFPFANEELIIVLEALKKIDKRHSMIVHYYYFENKTYQQIGVLMGITRERVRQILFKALKKLKRILTKEKFHGDEGSDSFCCGLDGEDVSQCGECQDGGDFTL